MPGAGWCGGRLRWLAGWVTALARPDLDEWSSAARCCGQDARGRLAGRRNRAVGRRQLLSLAFLPSSENRMRCQLWPVRVSRTICRARVPAAAEYVTEGDYYNRRDNAVRCWMSGQTSCTRPDSDVTAGRARGACGLSEPGALTSHVHDPRQTSEEGGQASTKHSGERSEAGDVLFEQVRTPGPFHA